MSALEREILKKFQQLRPDAKQRVRDMIELDLITAPSTTTFDYQAWIHEVEALRQQINHEQETSLDAVGLLRDIRDGNDQ